MVQDFSHQQYFGKITRCCWHLDCFQQKLDHGSCILRWSYQIVQPTILVYYPLLQLGSPLTSLVLFPLLTSPTYLCKPRDHWMGPIFVDEPKKQQMYEKTSRDCHLKIGDHVHCMVVGNSWLTPFLGGIKQWQMYGTVYNLERFPWKHRA